MSQHTYEPPTTEASFAPAAEPCASCGAPLAGDQRYCMYCGTRRATARIDFLDALASESAAAAAPLPAPAAERPPGVEGWLRDAAPSLTLAAVLLTTLLVGLLVGRWTAPSTPAAAPAAPQVIRITGGGQAAAPAAPTTTTAPATSTDGGDGASSGGAQKKDASGSKDTGATSTKGAADVKSLSKKQLDKAVKKGQPITTGSGKAAPPKDNKPAGGGSGFETIG